MPLWPGILRFGTFLSIALIESRCIFALGPSSSPSNTFPILLIHSAFLLCFLRSHILPTNCHVFLSSGCWNVFMHSPPTRRKIFLFLFWNVLFCLYCFILTSYLFNLSSFANTFWSSQTNYILHRLVRLITWCYALEYVLMIRLFFQFLPWLFSSLCFLTIVM